MTTCPFCGRDPYHYVDNGVGMEAVAVTCCELGCALFDNRDKETVTVAHDDLCRIGQRLADFAAANEKIIDAAWFAEDARETLQSYEKDYGEALPDDYELGRVEESRERPSFRIRVGHIRKLAAAITE